MNRRNEHNYALWCWYCERNFTKEEALLKHQRTSHFTCLRCRKVFDRALAVIIHAERIHGIFVDKVPNALPHRDDPCVDIFGMEGIPESDQKEMNMKLGDEQRSQSPTESSSTDSDRHRRRREWEEILCSNQLGLYTVSFRRKPNFYSKSEIQKKMGTAGWVKEISINDEFNYAYVSFTMKNECLRALNTYWSELNIQIPAECDSRRKRNKDGDRYGEKLDNRPADHTDADQRGALSNREHIDERDRGNSQRQPHDRSLDSVTQQTSPQAQNNRATGISEKQAWSNWDDVLLANKIGLFAIFVKQTGAKQIPKRSLRDRFAEFGPLNEVKSHMAGVTCLYFFKKEHALKALTNTKVASNITIGIPNECLKGKQDQDDEWEVKRKSKALKNFDEILRPNVYGQFSVLCQSHTDLSTEEKIRKKFQKFGNAKHIKINANQTSIVRFLSRKEALDVLCNFSETYKMQIPYECHRDHQNKVSTSAIPSILPTPSVSNISTVPIQGPGMSTNANLVNLAVAQNAMTRPTYPVIPQGPGFMPQTFPGRVNLPPPPIGVMANTRPVHLPRMPMSQPSVSPKVMGMQPAMGLPMMQGMPLQIIPGLGQNQPQQQTVGVDDMERIKEAQKRAKLIMEYEGILNPDKKGQYGVCLRIDLGLAKNDVAYLFGLAGNIVSTLSTERYIFIKYRTKDEALKAIEMFGDDFCVKAANPDNTGPVDVALAAARQAMIEEAKKQQEKLPIKINMLYKQQDQKYQEILNKTRKRQNETTNIGTVVTQTQNNGTESEQKSNAWNVDYYMGVNVHKEGLNALQNVSKDKPATKSKPPEGSSSKNPDKSEHDKVDKAKRDTDRGRGTSDRGRSDSDKGRSSRSRRSRSRDRRRRSRSRDKSRPNRGRRSRSRSRTKSSSTRSDHQKRTSSNAPKKTPLSPKPSQAKVTKSGTSADQTSNIQQENLEEILKNLIARNQGDNIIDVADSPSPERSDPPMDESGMVTSYYCKICKIRTQSTHHFGLHCSSIRHNRMYIELSSYHGDDFDRIYGNPDEPNSCLENEDEVAMAALCPGEEDRSYFASFYCKVCKIRMDSPKEFKSHLTVKAHQRLTEALRNTISNEEFSMTYGDPNDPYPCLETEQAEKLKETKLEVPPPAVTVKKVAELSKQMTGRQEKNTKAQASVEKVYAGASGLEQIHEVKVEPATNPILVAKVKKIIEDMGVTDARSKQAITESVMKKVQGQKLQGRVDQPAEVKTDELYDPFATQHHEAQQTTVDEQPAPRWAGLNATVGSSAVRGDASAPDQRLQDGASFQLPIPKNQTQEFNYNHGRTTEKLFQSDTLQNTRNVLESVGVTDKSSLVNFLARAGTIGEDGSEPLSLIDLINRAKVKMGDTGIQQPGAYQQSEESPWSVEGIGQPQQAEQQPLLGGNVPPLMANRGLSQQVEEMQWSDPNQQATRSTGQSQRTEHNPWLDSGSQDDQHIPPQRNEPVRNRHPPRTSNQNARSQGQAGKMQGQGRSQEPYRQRRPYPRSGRRPSPHRQRRR